MDATTITTLAQYLADVAETDETPITRVEMGEMADGSGRHYALAHTYDQVNELEQTYRVTTPAPETAPAWALRSYPTARIEVQVGDGWLELLGAEDVA